MGMVGGINWRLMVQTSLGINVRPDLKHKGTKAERRKIEGINWFMEMSQQNSLCSHLIQTKVSFFKNREQEGKTGPV
jgi:hypothetical protein